MSGSDSGRVRPDGGVVGARDSGSMMMGEDDAGVVNPPPPPPPVPPPPPPPPPADSGVADTGMIMTDAGMMMPPPMGDGGMMMPPPMGDGGMMMSPPMGDGGMMMPPPMGDGGMMPPPRPDGGMMMPPPMGDGGMMMPPGGDAGMMMIDGGSTTADAGSSTPGDCSLVPVCAGNATCFFKTTVSGLSVGCYQNASDGNRWYIHVDSNGLPDHAYSDIMNNIQPQTYSLDIPLEPSAPTGAGYSACGSEMWRNGMKGVAINGVSIAYPMSAAFLDPRNPPPPHMSEGTDYCSGHPTMFGAYHYHFGMDCLYGVYHNGALASGQITVPNNDPSIETSFERNEWVRPSGIVGFSLLGYPIYGPYADATGAAHTGLDACNGKLDASGNYGYYMTDTFPYILGCPGPGLPLDMADWSCTTYAPYP